MSDRNKNFSRFVTNDLLKGIGAFGEVYGPCNWNRKQVAVKKRWIRKEDTEKDTEKQLTACHKMISMQHKNLITVYDVSLEPPAIYIVMEYASGGTLKETLAAYKSNIPLNILKDWGIQIAEGMDYLHKRNIVHRDLKSPNIVILEADASSNPYNKTLKITDFDQIREHRGSKIMSLAGTCAWMAPEVLTISKFSHASDVWSYGVVLWEILTRKGPYKDISDPVIISYALNGQLKLEIPDTCPDNIKSILNKCMSNEKSKRPSFKEIQRYLQRCVDQDPRTNQLHEGQLKSTGQRLKEKLMLFSRRASLLKEKKISSSKAGFIMPANLSVSNVPSVRVYRDFLEERMDPDFGLLDKLRADGTIGWKEVDEVRSLSSVRKRNSQLLVYILANDQCDGLIAALRDADQMHIANYLTANGEYSDEFDEDWPLTGKEISILDTNHGSLVDLLQLPDLLGLLCSTKVINKRQNDSISSKATPHERNDALLDILRRRSLRDYHNTIICLCDSQQTGIAELLDSGGVVVRAHINLLGENVTNDEIEIASRVETLLSNSSFDASRRILGLVQSRVMAAKIGQSIVLYIYCKTIYDLEQLRGWQTSGRLKNSVELWFNSLLRRSQKIAVAAPTISTEDFQKMRTYFKDDDFSRRDVTERHSKNYGEAENWPSSQFKASGTTPVSEQPPSKAELNRVPTEVLDIILEKSLLYWIMNTSFHQRDADVIKSLASVDFCCFDRLTRKKFKRRIWRQWREFYGRNSKRCVVMRNNREFLLKNIQPNKELIGSMLSLDCITDEQSRLIQLQLSSCNKTRMKAQSDFIQETNSKPYATAQLMHLARTFDQTKSSNFVRSLRRTNQKIAARIIENGGVVIKVEVQNLDVKCTTSMQTQRLHETIESLLSRIKPRSHETDKLISQLKDDGIEIINSQQDKDALLVWIWCRSQAAIEKAKSNELAGVFFGLENIRTSASSNAIRLENIQLQKTIVVCPILDNIPEITHVLRNYDVFGVKKLRFQIYVLCRLPFPSSTHEICVFKDLTSFHLQTNIEIKEIDSAAGMESSEKDKCIYVSDFAKKKCVWKIEREIDDQYKIVKWLTMADNESFTMSVSSGGQLQILKALTCILATYGSDAELLWSIQLHTDIEFPRHVVETAIGNYIILHQWLGPKEKEESESSERNAELHLVVSEVTRDGQMVIRRFIPSNNKQQLTDPRCLSLDSDGRVFVADGGSKVVLLGSDLKWIQIISTAKELNEGETGIQRTECMFYDEEEKQLLVGSALHLGDEIKLRAIHDFDAKQLRNEERIELKRSLESRRFLDLPYAEALSFKRGDKMETIYLETIGTKIEWWMARHLNSTGIGFIRRNHVVIENDSHPPSTTKLNELPMGLEADVLEKSFLQWILKSPIQRVELVVKTLASVDFCWFIQTTRSSFKKRIWQRLKDFYGLNNRISAIIRHNQNYFLDNIQSHSKLIASMLSLNCITEEQSHFIQRQRSNCIESAHKNQGNFVQEQRSIQDKNTELLHVMRSFDDKKFSNFIRCLRETHQTTAAKIMDNGGGVIKVEVQNRCAKCTRSRETQLIFHKGIGDLRNKTKPRSYQIDELISQLKDEGIEILNSQLDRETVVVWIWCRTESALANCQRVYESNQLRDVLFGVANIHSSIPEIDQSLVISIDSDQFKKPAVVCPISINFIRKINVGRNYLLRGVTKLRNEIYVICKLVIRVYGNRYPFNLQKIIEIKQIEEPYDSASSEAVNCLYVADYKGKCVWKITREREDQHNIFKWLTTDYEPCSLSMSSDNELLVVSYSSSILRIYGSDAQLMRSIQLSTDIKGNVVHAVETSSGNFIICSCEEVQLEEGEEEEAEVEEQKKVEEEEAEVDEKKEELDEEEKVEEIEEEEVEKMEKMEEKEVEDELDDEEEENKEEGQEEVEEAEEEEEGGDEVEEEEEEEEEYGETERENKEGEFVTEEKEESVPNRRKRKANNNRYSITELTRDGQMILRRFIPSNKTQKLGSPGYLSLDSDDRVFVADRIEGVILLDSNLKWNRILASQSAYHLFYDKEMKQLIVEMASEAAVYNLNRT